MNNREFKKSLQSIKTRVQPTKQWKAQQREVLLHAMKAQTTMFNTESANRKLAFKLSGLVMRPVGAFAMVFVVMFGSVIASVSAATYSTPGQMLYSLKLTTERLQVSMISDKKDKANLQLSFAKKRLQEIKDVVKYEPDQAKVQEKIKQPIENLKTAIATVKIAVEVVKKEDNNKAIEIVANLKDVANTAADVVKDPAVAKAVAATEASDKKIADDKVIADKANADKSETQISADKVSADIAATQINADKTDEQKASEAKDAQTVAVGAAIKDLVADAVTTTKDAQASVIRELAAKDPAKAKDEIKKYIDLLKQEREVQTVQPIANDEPAADAQPNAPDAAKPADTTTAATAPVKTDAEKAVDVKSAETQKLIDAKAIEAQKALDAKAAEDKKKFDDMITQTLALLDKDDIAGAMKLLGIDVAPTAEAPNAPDAPATDAKTEVPKTDAKVEVKETAASATPATNTNTLTIK